MAATETRSIVISNDAGRSSAGTMHMKLFGPGDRMRRALGGLGIMWLLAVVTVLIPLAHFVLVPGFLLAGPVLAYMRYRVTEQSESVTGTCPSCHQEFTLALDAADRLPLRTYCPPMQDPIRVDAAADVAAAEVSKA